MKIFAILALCILSGISVYGQISFEDPVSYDGGLLLFDGQHVYRFQIRMSDRIYFSHSDDAGRTFQPERLIWRTNGDAGLFSAIVAEGTLHFVVTEGFNTSILYFRSTDHGDSFSIANPFNFRIGEAVGDLRLAASGNNVFVAFFGTPLRNQIYLAASFNGGETFDLYELIKTENVGGLSLAATGDDVYIRWSEGPPFSFYFIHGSVDPSKSFLKFWGILGNGST